MVDSVYRATETIYVTPIVLSRAKGTWDVAWPSIFPLQKKHRKKKRIISTRTPKPEFEHCSFHCYSPRRHYRRAYVRQLCKLYETHGRMREGESTFDFLTVFSSRYLYVNGRNEERLEAFLCRVPRSVSHEGDPVIPRKAQDFSTSYAVRVESRVSNWFSNRKSKLNIFMTDSLVTMRKMSKDTNVSLSSHSKPCTMYCICCTIVRKRKFHSCQSVMKPIYVLNGDTTKNLRDERMPNARRLLPFQGKICRTRIRDNTGYAHRWHVSLRDIFAPVPRWP